MTLGERIRVAWRVSLCQSVPLVVSEVGVALLPRRNMPSPDFCSTPTQLIDCQFWLSWLGLIGLLVGPTLGLLWARRVVPAAATSSYLALIPLYVALFFWVALDPLLRWQIGDLLAAVGVPLLDRQPWVVAANASSYALATLLLTCWGASWQRRSTERDLPVLVAVIILILLLIRWWGPPPIL
jgi:hypothetical protein